ncbi:DnaD domain protein [Paenibacillus sp. O199]|uniref:DnaD domain protein n=1 Tax=Paenibacillus sp. O199 TaxID=1643925 RepID=UPI0007BFE087|nr:DnaD domain protein [Paenibacillus sp. O199]
MTETARPTLSGLLEQFEAIGGPEEFGPEGIAIMVALWRRSAKLGWRKAWKMTNTDLMVQTGITNKGTLNAHRKKLVEAGLIAYIQPPRGQSKGDYSVEFDLLGVGVEQNLNHFDSYSEEVGQKVEQNLDHFDGVGEKVEQNLNHFPQVEQKVEQILDPVLKDLLLSSSASSSATTDANQIDRPPDPGYESFYSAHKRVFGFECNPFQAQQLIVYIDEDKMDEAVVIRAMERAALAAIGYRFTLITKILGDYLRSGAKTIEAAKALDDAFEAKKGSSVTTGSVSSGRRQQPSRQQQKRDSLQQRLREEEARGKG